MVITYALCGFSSFCSLGICIGAMSALAPTRSNVFAQLAVLAQIGGNITCFLTACFAGDENIRDIKSEAYLFIFYLFLFRFII